VIDDVGESVERYSVGKARRGASHAVPGNFGRRSKTMSSVMSKGRQARHYLLGFLALGAAAWLGNPPAWVAEAATGMGGGTAIQIGGIDNIAATVADYASGNVGKMIAIVMVMGGLGMSLSGRMGSGMGVAGTGIAAAFAPNIVDTAFDTADGAPLVPVMQTAALALPGGVLGLLSQVGLALLWPLTVAVKVLRDPVAWLAVGVAATLRPGLLSAWVRAWIGGLGQREAAA